MNLNFYFFELSKDRPVSNDSHKAQDFDTFLLKYYFYEYYPTASERFSIQHATRLIDYYARQRIQESPRIDTKEDHEVQFASVKRDRKPTQGTGASRKTDVTRRVRHKAANRSRGVGRTHSQESCGETPENSALFRNSVTESIALTATSAEAVSSNKTTDHQSNFRGKGCGRGRGYQ
ncbi:hypothetical protein AYI69_g3219 [Smittium culicis]|uniref:Uncharacterized protein n=1 Tax=Smittium culicis TaxID=133412 RepID=A0A1R1YKA0_9FUNG|nr:hypothetical protein AYI69_g3219 [Smittium culicis]